MGGFCSQAAIDFPPGDPSYGYLNLYTGHTKTTEPALGAGCNVSDDGDDLWDYGAAEVTSIGSLSVEGLPEFLVYHCARNSDGVSEPVWR